MAMKENSIVQKDIDPIYANIILTIKGKNVASTTIEKMMNIAAVIKINGEYFLKLMQVELKQNPSTSSLAEFPHFAFKSAVIINRIMANASANGIIGLTYGIYPKYQTNPLAEPISIPRIIKRIVDMQHLFLYLIQTPPYTNLK